MVFEDNRLISSLYGEQNAHLKSIEKALDVELNSRGNEILISGSADHIGQAKQVLEALWLKLQQGQNVDSQTVNSALRFLDDKMSDQNDKKAPKAKGFKEFTNDQVLISTKKKKISPRSPNQSAYMQAMYENPLVFGLGPAGTGKTYLAVAMAVSMMEKGEIEKIILSRPAVEAGERLGFLPGEMREKMDPYLRPLYDALFDTMSGEKVQKKIASEEIEIAPLAFMRGRTLKNAFVILDEAQNTTSMQMMMVLTRMGQNSRMVITGDTSQIDLPNNEISGLKEARTILSGEKEIGFVEFSSKDVVRHHLVSKIIDAYDKHKNKNKK